MDQILEGYQMVLAGCELMNEGFRDFAKFMEEPEPKCDIEVIKDPMIKKSPQMKYYEGHKDEILKKGREKYNTDEAKQKKKDYYQKNQDKLKQKSKERYHNKVKPIKSDINIYPQDGSKGNDSSRNVIQRDNPDSVHTTGSTIQS